MHDVNTKVLDDASFQSWYVCALHLYRFRVGV